MFLIQTNQTLSRREMKQKWKLARSLSHGVLLPLPKPTLFKVTQKNNPPNILFFFKYKAGRSMVGVKVVLVICAYGTSCSQIFGAVLKALGPHLTHSYNWVCF